MANNNTLNGRPTKKADWPVIDALILNGLNKKQIASELDIQPSTLNAMTLRTHGFTFLDYSRKLKARLGKTIRAFSFEDTHKLLIHYYSGKLSRLDHAKTDTLPPVRAWYPKVAMAPSTGKRLMELVSSRDLDGVMEKLREVSVEHKGVTLTRGYEYPLMCWINPHWQNHKDYQKVELPPFLEYLETYGYWDFTRVGLRLTKEALLEFNKHLNALLTVKHAKPKRKESW